MPENHHREKGILFSWYNIELKVQIAQIGSKSLIYIAKAV